jgi:SSS family solute:Na+ symporter
MNGISGVLYQYLQSVQSYLAPPIAVVFLLGLTYKRVNTKGAMAALIVGFALGMLRIGLELNKASLSGFLYDFANMNFLYFCISLFVFSVVLMITVSLFTEPPKEEQLSGLTFATVSADQQAASRSSWSAVDVILSLGVVVFIIGVFMYFSSLGVGG